MTIYHCPLCGGRAANARHVAVLDDITDNERRRLINLTKNLRTVQDVAGAFGEPDFRRTMSMGGNPDTTKFYPVMIYAKLSTTADVHVMIFPADRVGISFQPKQARKAAA